MSRSLDTSSRQSPAPGPALPMNAAGWFFISEPRGPVASVFSKAPMAVQYPLGHCQCAPAPCRASAQAAPGGPGCGFKTVMGKVCVCCACAAGASSEPRGARSRAVRSQCLRRRHAGGLFGESPSSGGGGITIRAVNYWHHGSVLPCILAQGRRELLLAASVLSHK